MKYNGKELSKNETLELESLENILKLEAIRDARFYCKEKIKVKFYFSYFIPLKEVHQITSNRPTLKAVKSKIKVITLSVL